MRQHKEQILSFCDHCKVFRTFSRRLNPPNHMVHVILSIILCGLWLPVWALSYILFAIRSSRTPYRCEHCGHNLVPAKR